MSSAPFTFSTTVYGLHPDTERALRELLELITWVQSLEAGGPGPSGGGGLLGNTNWGEPPVNYVTDPEVLQLLGYGEGGWPPPGVYDSGATFYTTTIARNPADFVTVPLDHTIVPTFYSMTIGYNPVEYVATPVFYPINLPELPPTEPPPEGEEEEPPVVGGPNTPSDTVIIYAPGPGPTPAEPPAPTEPPMPKKPEPPSGPTEGSPPPGGGPLQLPEIEVGGGGTVAPSGPVGSEAILRTMLNAFYKAGKIPTLAEILGGFR